MTDSKPVITTADGSRQFACSPAAVLGIIVNKREEILLLAHPDLGGCWQVVNGAMEAGETVLNAALREITEEAGSEIQVHPLGTVHVSTFHYDQQVRYMLSIAYLFAYRGGEVQPGDDMQGSEYRWMSLEEINQDQIELIIPPGEKWVLARAVELFRLWLNENTNELKGFDLSERGNK